MHLGSLPIGHWWRFKDNGNGLRNHQRIGPSARHGERPWHRIGTIAGTTRRIPNANAAIAPKNHSRRTAPACGIGTDLFTARSGSSRLRATGKRLSFSPCGFLFHDYFRHFRFNNKTTFIFLSSSHRLSLAISPSKPKTNQFCSSLLSVSNIFGNSPGEIKKIHFQRHQNMYLFSVS